MITSDKTLGDCVLIQKYEMPFKDTCLLSFQAMYEISGLSLALYHGDTNSWCASRNLILSRLQAEFTQHNRGLLFVLLPLAWLTASRGLTLSSIDMTFRMEQFSSAVLTSVALQELYASLVKSI